MKRFWICFEEYTFFGLYSPKGCLLCKGMALLRCSTYLTWLTPSMMFFDFYRAATGTTHILRVWSGVAVPGHGELGTSLSRSCRSWPLICYRDWIFYFYSPTSPPGEPILNPTSGEFQPTDHSLWVDFSYSWQAISFIVGNFLTWKIAMQEIWIMRMDNGRMRNCVNNISLTSLCF